MGGRGRGGPRVAFKDTGSLARMLSAGMMETCDLSVFLIQTLKVTMNHE